MAYKTFEEMSKALDELESRLKYLEERQHKVSPHFPWDERPTSSTWNCGKCGMEFETGRTYGMTCNNYDCPTGLGPTRC